MYPPRPVGDLEDRVLDLPYHANPMPLVAALRPSGRVVLLQDDRPDGCDLITAAPRLALDVHGQQLTWSDASGRRHENGDAFSALDALFERAGDGPTLLPRVFGLAGYDAGRDAHATSAAFPDLTAGLHDWVLRTDHRLRRTQLLVATGAEVPSAIVERLRDPPPVASAPPPVLAPELSRAEYGRAFAQIHAYLRAGDCYQVNLAVPFSGAFDADPLALYAALSARQPAPFAGYLERDEGAVLSCSPERLLRVDGREVTSSPIKGTRPRAALPQADEAARRALRASAKDRAENLMIVDLLRNDLGRSCEPGTIEVPELFSVESYAAVHHLVSTVRGRLTPEVTAVRALAAAFPGGSITGAPKRRAMEIIDELEPRARGPYCGSLFHGRGRDQLDASITIRTLLASDGRLTCWGGGGIVADSQVDDEWAEIHAKVGTLIR